MQTDIMSFIMTADLSCDARLCSFRSTIFLFPSKNTSI